MIKLIKFKINLVKIDPNQIPTALQNANSSNVNSQTHLFSLFTTLNRYTGREVLYFLIKVVFNIGLIFSSLLHLKVCPAKKQ